MSRNRNRHNQNGNNNNRGANEKEYLDKMADRFIETDLDSYMKKNKKLRKEEGLSKKKIKKMYYAEMLDLIPDVADWVFQFGYKRDQDTIAKVDAIYNKTLDPKFTDALFDFVADGNRFKNQKDLPIFMREMIRRAEIWNAELEKRGEDTRLDVRKMEKISMHFMADRLERFEKAGIDPNIAYNALSIIPYPKMLSTDREEVADKYCRSVKYRVRQFFSSMYSASKTDEIPFGKLMKLLTDDDGDLYRPFIVYSLLERKDRYGTLTDSQKKFYLTVTSWTFDTLEQYDEEGITAILNQYIHDRQFDERNGKDCNRRYNLTTLIEADYPKIVKVIKAMIFNNEEVKKYL